MKSNSIEFSVKELIYLFLKKKSCPKCKEKMVKQSITRDMGENLIRSMGHYYHGTVYKTKIYYRCNNCDLTFSIKELF